MKVSSVKEAWELANRLFPTDYEKDEERSIRAGYPIFYSTANGVNAWISDLGNRLELNYADGKLENIWIELDEDKSSLSYKIFITDSSEAASLIAKGLANTSAQNCVHVSHGSASGSVFNEMIPDIYKKKHGGFYAALVYRSENGKPEYELTIC